MGFVIWLHIFCVLIPIVDPSVAENGIFGEVKLEMRDCLSAGTGVLTRVGSTFGLSLEGASALLSENMVIFTSSVLTFISQVLGLNSFLWTDLLPF